MYPRLGLSKPFVCRIRALFAGEGQTGRLHTEAVSSHGRSRSGNALGLILVLTLLGTTPKMGGCFGGGGGDPQTYTVGGAVSGLAGSGLVLQDNGGDNLSITSNGSFTFGTVLDNGAAYKVTVLTQPSNPIQTCTVTSGTGTINGTNVTNVSVTCASSNFTIGGTVSGLAGSGLVLQDNGGNNLAISANGSFTFSTALASGASYNVTVYSEPVNPGQVCGITSGSGTVSGSNVTSISLNCVTDTFTVGGTVSGLAGSGLVLQDNGGNNLPISANGSFTFSTPVAGGAPYNVTVFSEPTNLSQTCTVTSGSGTMASSNVTNVAVNCVTDNFSIGGQLSGLTGSGMVLQDNGGDNLSVSSNGGFTFSTQLVSGSSYNVTILTQPGNPTQSCAVSNGSGNVTISAITNVQISCHVTTTAVFVSDYSNARVLGYSVPLSTGQSASVVLGQPNFTSKTSALSASGMKSPSWLAMDNAGNLYVADDQYCRVVQFQPSFSNGMNASIVFGQANFTTANCSQSTSANTLGGASGVSTGTQVFGVAIDPSGNLWVADDGNNRVLEYVPPFSSGMAATLAIGQQDLTSGAANQGNSTPNASSLSMPGCAFDAAGNLWVADFGNNRVLEFVPPFSTGMSASLVIGKGNFTDGGSSSTTASTLAGPNGIAFDGAGDLWISEMGNNRALEFVPPFSNGMSASLVLGQPDFTGGAANQAGSANAATLSGPGQIAFDSSGNLYITDWGNDRTLMFTPPFSTGMNASVVIGQPNFTSTAAGTTATGQSAPSGLITAPPLN
jgi:sugar lactone lactonase YvrE